MGMIYAEQIEHMDVESMQQMHEDEIKILNDIDNLAISYEMGDGNLSELEEKIEEYIVHVKEHFVSEEVLMEKYHYPEYEMHKMAHDMFLSDLEHSVRQWKARGDIKKIIYFIRKTPEWLLMHVNSVDTGTAHYLAQKMDAQK